MATFQSVNSKKNGYLIDNNRTQPIDLEKEVQLMRERASCSLPFLHDYKLMSDEHAVEELVHSNLTFVGATLKNLQRGLLCSLV